MAPSKTMMGRVEKTVDAQAESAADHKLLSLRVEISSTNHAIRRARS